MAYTQKKKRKLSERGRPKIGPKKQKKTSERGRKKLRTRKKIKNALAYGVAKGRGGGVGRVYEAYEVKRKGGKLRCLLLRRKKNYIYIYLLCDYMGKISLLMPAPPPQPPTPRPPPTTTGWREDSDVLSSANCPSTARCSKDVTTHQHRPGARPGRLCPVPACSGQPRPAREDSDAKGKKVQNEEEKSNRACSGQPRPAREDSDAKGKKVQNEEEKSNRAAQRYETIDKKNLL
jgi:hypothetical protein